MRRVLQYTGVAAVVVVWSTLLAATAITGFDLLGEHPLSYLATQSRSAVLFTIGLGLSAVLFVAFHAQVRRRHAVGLGFSTAMLAGLAGQMVAAFVPIGGHSTAHRIHTVSALALGASLPILMWRFAAGQAHGPWRRLAYVLFWAEAAACGLGLYLSANGVAPLAEIFPGAVFHAWVVSVTVAGVSAGMDQQSSDPLTIEPRAGARLHQPNRPACRGSRRPFDAAPRQPALAARLRQDR